jgi:hypothetical protein
MAIATRWYVHVFVHVAVPGSEAAIRAVACGIILGQFLILADLSEVVSRLHHDGLIVAESGEHGTAVLFHPFTLKVLPMLFAIQFVVDEVGNVIF